jgi:hypothetical protein
MVRKTHHEGRAAHAGKASKPGSWFLRLGRFRRGWRGGFLFQDVLADELHHACRQRDQRNAEQRAVKNPRDGSSIL